MLEKGCARIPSAPRTWRWYRFCFTSGHRLVDESTDVQRLGRRRPVNGGLVVQAKCYFQSLTSVWESRGDSLPVTTYDFGHRSESNPSPLIMTLE